MQIALLRILDAQAVAAVLQWRSIRAQARHPQGAKNHCVRLRRARGGHTTGLPATPGALTQHISFQQITYNPYMNRCYEVS